MFQVLSKDEGGRYTPFMSNYRPQLFIRTADVTVGLTFPEGTENPEEKMVMLHIYICDSIAKVNPRSCPATTSS